VLIARLDNVGDVLLTGPAVRAVAAGASRVTFLCSPTGAAAAHLLPGVDEVVVHAAGWIDADPEPIDRRRTMALVDRLTGGIDEAVICTSFHQSPLPLALLLRLAGVSTIAAISVDYPGSLLDVRHRVDDDCHEVERALSLVATMGYHLPPGDDGLLAVNVAVPGAAFAGWDGEPYVVVHPGASVSARAWHPDRCAAAVEALADAGYRVVVTGGPGEVDLTARVAARADRDRVVDLGGQSDLAGLAGVLAGAAAVVVGNTGPAHLAAAVGTPVVSIYAPTVPASRWAPWGVAHEILGDQGIACAGCRSRVCPVPGHPCVDRLEVAEVVAAVARLTARRAAA
jgi:ADP-heptose:LPS heptosyltransferase